MKTVSQKEHQSIKSNAYLAIGECTLGNANWFNNKSDY